jgi:predicted nucleic acid-binding protein
MRTIRVVLDTNVVVSAHLNSEGYERHVLDLALAGKIKLAFSGAFSRSMRECCGGLSFA